MCTQDFAGKVAFVTGAGQGLGEHVARLLSERGAHVVVADIDAAAAARTADLIDASGGRAFAVALDVADESQWFRALETVERRCAKVDVLVNNAGIIKFGRIESMEVDVFDLTMRINVRGTFLGCKAILPLMRAAGGGAIVNVGSMGGLIAHRIGSAAYATSKGAVRMLTKAVAMDYLEHHIRVNSVLPGSMDTPFSRPKLLDPELRKVALGRTPMERPADPSEVARTVAFLASDEASYMTGSDLVVDGGWTAC